MVYTTQDRQCRLEEMCRLATSRVGACLSKQFVDNKTKLRWRCAKGHEWKTIPQNVIRNHWCKICGNERQGQLKAHTIEMMRKSLPIEAANVFQRPTKTILQMDVSDFYIGTVGLLAHVAHAGIAGLCAYVGIGSATIVLLEEERHFAASGCGSCIA